MGDLIVQQELFCKQKFVEQMRAMFKKFMDVEECVGAKEDADVFITLEQFKQHMSQEEVQAYLETQQLFSGDLFRLFELLDHDGEGTLSLKEFIHGCLHLKGQARCSDVVLLLAETRKVNCELRQMHEDLVEQLW